MIAKLAVSKKTEPGVVEAFKDDMAGCKPEITHGDFQVCNRFDVLERLLSI
jgi:hypothetical protein